MMNIVHVMDKIHHFAMPFWENKIDYMFFNKDVKLKESVGSEPCKIGYRIKITLYEVVRAAGWTAQNISGN